jgi:hypothetical protein
MADSPFKLRLSHAADWVKCAAFPAMNRREEAAVVEAQADHTVREEGTAIHWVAERMFHDRDFGSIAPNGVIITDELLDVAELYVAWLREQFIPWRVEELLRAVRIHPECGGTPDAYGHSLFEQLIEVADCKGGFGVVEVWPNSQLIGYLAAILDANPTWEQPNTRVRFTIIQPRAFHPDGPVRSVTVPLSQVYPYIEELRQAAHKAMGETAPAVAGPQCDNCSARVICGVAHRAGMRALEVSGEPVVHSLTPEAVDYEMLRIEEAARMLQARLTGLQAQAAHMIRNGRNLPHYAMQSKAGKLDWIDDDAMRSAIAMGDLYGKDLRKPQVAITPTQAAAVIPKELLETYARRSKGAAKLVKFDSKSVSAAFSKFCKE